MMETKSNRLRTARIGAGFKSTLAVSERLGIGASTYRAHENGQNEFNEEHAARYGRLFKVDPAYLLFGGKPDLNHDAELERYQQAIPDSKHIPDLAIHGGLGDGGVFEILTTHDGFPTVPDQVRGYWTFPDYLVRGLGNLDKIYAWEVKGDSMEPTLPGGSVVFVDTDQNKLPPDDIYALDYGDGLMVKRLKLLPGTELVSIISDNEHYGKDDLPRSDVRVYGRIVGWFQWRG